MEANCYLTSMLGKSDENIQKEIANIEGLDGIVNERLYVSGPDVPDKRNFAVDPNRN